MMRCWRCGLEQDHETHYDCIHALQEAVKAGQARVAELRGALNYWREQAGMKLEESDD